MKKIFLTLFIAVVILFIYHFFIWGHFGNGYYIVQPNRTILRKKDNKNFLISNILNIKESKQYLIALRLPEKFYTCPHGSIVVCRPTLKYFIINKYTSKAYETDSYEKFKQKLKGFKINKIFSIQEINKAKKIISSYKKVCSNKEDIKLCKEIHSYKIEEF